MTLISKHQQYVLILHCHCQYTVTVIVNETCDYRLGFDVILVIVTIVAA